MKYVSTQAQIEVNRISENVANALAAIAEKGVTVPDDSGSDALAALIRAIETGGLPEGFTAVETGTYTPTSNKTSFTITYTLGVRPNFVIVFPVDLDELVNSSGVAFVAYIPETGSVSGVYSNMSRVNAYKSSSTNFPSTFTREGQSSSNLTTTSTYVMSNNSSRFFTGGVTYYWVAANITALEVYMP